MLIDVALAPREVAEPRAQVAIVVDVIRASTSIAALFAAGCPRLYVARTLDAGRAYARRQGLVLCGERGGARPPGFDFGNSPSEFARRDFAGRPALLCTTNGTVALHAVAAAPAVFVGSLANATAVVSAAVEAAGPVGRLTVVCAGREGRFALDDAWTAGRLASLATEQLGEEAILGEAARAAMALTVAMPDALAAFRQGGSARALLPLGLEADVAFAAEQDRYALAPRLVGEGEETPWPVLLAPHQPETPDTAWDKVRPRSVVGRTRRETPYEERGPKRWSSSSS